MATKQAMLEKEMEAEGIKQRMVPSAKAEPAGWHDDPSGDIWAAEGQPGHRQRVQDTKSCSDAAGQLVLAALLIAELGLWIQVLYYWLDSEVGYNQWWAVLPCVVPSIIIPALAVLHSLFRGRLSFKMSLVLIIPPSPIILHIILMYKALKGEERTRWNVYSRICGQLQGLLMSAPLTVLAISMLVTAATQQDKVDLALLHSHMFRNSHIFIASSISFLNLLIVSYRYNERISHGPVALLVGFPFLLTTISYRLIAFAALFTFFENAWICLAFGLLFCVSCLAVQLASNFTLCSKLFSRACGSLEDSSRAEKESSFSSSLLLSIGGVFFPVGYGSDVRMGHAGGKGWRLLLVNWLGCLIIASIVVSHATTHHVPNTFTGLSAVNMKMLLPETEITVKTGGNQIDLHLPETFMSMFSGTPAKASFSTSNKQDIILSILIPVGIAFLTVPFTILRIILLGWKCQLRRDVELTYGDSSDDDSEARLRYSEENIRFSASRSRNCCTVVWSLYSLMAASCTFTMLCGIYFFLIMHSATTPHQHQVPVAEQ